MTVYEFQFIVALAALHNVFLFLYHTYEKKRPNVQRLNGKRPSRKPWDLRDLDVLDGLDVPKQRYLKTQKV